MSAAHDVTEWGEGWSEESRQRGGERGDAFSGQRSLEPCQTIGEKVL